MTYFIVGIVVFLLLSIWGRVMAERNLQLLSLEQKGLLVTAFSKSRLASTLILVAIILCFLAFVYFKTFDPRLATYGYFLIILLYFLLTGIYSHLRIQKLDLPKKYIQMHLRLVILRIIGMAVFLYCILQGMLPTLTNENAQYIHL